MCQVAIIVNEHVRGSEGPYKEHAKPIDPSLIVLDNKVGSLEFLSTSLPLTPQQIGIS